MSDARAIPSIEQLRQRPAAQALVVRYGHEAVVEALRRAAAEVREHLREAGEAVPRAVVADRITDSAATRLSGAMRGSLVRVINATGVIVHTNLGRAPLSPAAIDAICRTAGGYTNLEYDLDAGRRGARDTLAEPLLCRLTGAEAAVVVNNCAAATLLVLATTAGGREVLVSRQELVEIGGGFRVPDVMRQSGARLREVGTTNRTRVADYALAIGASTGAVLRVHTSNFRLEGFVERPAVGELVALGRRFSVPVIEDLGSGAVARGDEGPLADEPTVQGSVTAGVDLVCFSGDKLLGGPQAGIIVGRRDLLALVRRHPLLRALRVDKLTYAALEATLLEHLAGRAHDRVPVQRMVAQPVSAIAERATRLAGLLAAGGWRVSIVDGWSTIGGGSAPGRDLPTRLVAISRDGWSADRLEAALRASDPPVVARIEDDRVVLDLRTVANEDEGPLVQALHETMRTP